MKLNPDFEGPRPGRDDSEGGGSGLSEMEKKALVQQIAIRYFRPHIECLQIILGRCLRWLQEHEGDPVDFELMFETVGLYEMQELENNGVIRILRTKARRNDLIPALDYHATMAAKTLRLAFGGD